MKIEAASQKKLLLAQTQQWELDRLKLQEMQKNAEIESARQQEEANAAREGAQRLLEEFKKKEALLNAKVEEKLKELKEMEASLNNQVEQNAESEVAAAKEEAAALLKEFKDKEGKLNTKIQENELEAARLQAVSIAARQQADALVEREKFLAREAELNAKIVEQQLALEKNKNSEATRRLGQMQAQLEELQKQNLLAKKNEQNLGHEQNLAAFNNLVMDKDDQTLVSELTGHDKGGIAPQYTVRDDPTTDGNCNVNKCGIEFSDEGCFVNCAEEGGFEMMVQGFLKWFMGDGENSCGSSFWECSTLDDATFQEKKADYKKKKMMMKEEEAKKGAKKEVVKTETMKSTNSV